MWSEQEKQWARWAESRGSYPAAKAQKEVLAAHQALLRSIELGDEEHAARLARSHLDKSQRYTLAEAHGAVVQAPPMRGTAT
jgi:DNA-binding FadR family transcriptional regulator